MKLRKIIGDTFNQRRANLFYRNCTSLSISQQAVSILRKYGNKAHAWIPGIGTVSGLNTGNYIETTTRNSAVDEQVGLVLDACGSVGSELITSTWTPDAGITESLGVLTFNSAASSAYCFNTGTVIAGKTYKTTVIVSGYSGSGGISFANNGASVGAVYNANGTYTQHIVATQSGAISVRARLATTTCVVSSISVREVTGIHPANTLSTACPKLRRGAVNLLTNSATPATQSVTLAALPYTLVIVGSGSVQAGSFGTQTGDGVLNFTATAGSCTFTKTGTVTSFALFQGTYTAAQIAALGGIPVTTTAPVSTALGNYYWEFDGTDDCLQTGVMDLSYTDKVTVIAGVTKLGAIDGVADSVCELSSAFDTNNGAFAVGAPGISKQFSFITKGTSVGRADDSTAGHAAPYSSVVTGISSIGDDICTLRINGEEIESTVLDQGTGNYGSTYPLNIGSRNKISTFLKGKLHPLIIIGAKLPDNEIRILEKFVAKLTGPLGLSI